MRRALLIALALVPVLGVLAGCGEKRDETKAGVAVQPGDYQAEPGGNRGGDAPK